MRIRFRARDLLAASDTTGRRRIVLANTTPIRAPHVTRPRPVVRRKGMRLFVITPVRDVSGRLMISVVPITPGRILAHLLRR